jgi:hypothetical protein
MFRVCHDLLSVFGFGLSFLRDSRVCGVFAMDPLSGLFVRRAVYARCLQCTRSAGGAAHSAMPRETSFRRWCSLHESRLPPRAGGACSHRNLCSADERVRGHWRIVWVSCGGRRMTYALPRNACGPYASGFDTCRCGGLADGR